MVSTGIEYLIAHDRCQELRKGHGAPYHQNDQTKEPFQEVDVIIGMHQSESYQRHQHRDDKSRQTKAAGDEEVGDERSYRSTTVLILLMGVQQFTGTPVQQQTLVSLSCREIGDEGDGDIYCQQQQDKSEDEIEYIVLEDIAKAYSL